MGPAKALLCSCRPRNPLGGRRCRRLHVGGWSLRDCQFLACAFNLASDSGRRKPQADQLVVVLTDIAVFDGNGNDAGVDSVHLGACLLAVVDLWLIRQFAAELVQLRE